MPPARPLLTRRAALLGLTSAISIGPASLALAAAPVPAAGQRFVVVILRGALDGLAAVVPYGDSNLAAWRAELVPPQPGSASGLLDLGGFYGLHPELTGLHDMYSAGAMLPIHAVAGPYRSRSHFEAQDYLESGADHRMTSGWLNRVVGLLPSGERGSSPGGPAMAIGASMPLLLRGPATIGSWAPSSFAEPEPDLYARLAALSRDDKLIGPAIAEGLRERGFTDEVVSAAEATSQKGRPAFPLLCGFAARMLAAADGPRIAALEIGGWDTHAGQLRRLSAALRQLDDGLAALKSGLGDAWASTVVLVVTEFGRTVRMNGTKGTDHGTGTVAFALGGAIAGGHVRANWPGLARSNLLEDRDLQPTADLRSVAKGLLADHLKLPSNALAQVFPGSAAALPMHGLVRTGRA
jgi:uncharacterized protein (DUF1501 family)